MSSGKQRDTVEQNETGWEFYLPGSARVLTCMHGIVVLSFPVAEELRDGAETFEYPSAFAGWDWRLGISIEKHALFDCLWFGGLKSI